MDGDQWERGWTSAVKAMTGRSRRGDLPPRSRAEPSRVDELSRADRASGAERGFR